MKFFASLAIVAAFVAAPVAAQDVTPVDPATATQGLGALGGTTALGIVAAVVTVAIIVAANDDDDDSSSTTN